MLYAQTDGCKSMATDLDIETQRNHEKQWVHQIAQQDQMALSKLYDRYARLIYSVAYRSLGSAEESEEVVMDVFAQVWRTADRYDGAKARVDTWLLMMARSRVCDRLRSGQRRGKVAEALIQFEAPMERSSPGPSEDLEIQERRSTVIAALSDLPPEQRQVLELAYYGGLSHREIADQTGVAIGTVKTRVRLGLEKLRSALQSWSMESA
jgi:RNA polymerase sigma factor (sigma-70 family)